MICSGVCFLPFIESLLGLQKASKDFHIIWYHFRGAAHLQGDNGITFNNSTVIGQGLYVASSTNLVVNNNQFYEGYQTTAAIHSQFNLGDVSVTNCNAED